MEKRVKAGGWPALIESKLFFQPVQARSKTGIDLSLLLFSGPVAQ
jgi:hypothetical protein